MDRPRLEAAASELLSPGGAEAAVGGGRGHGHRGEVVAGVGRAAGMEGPG